MRCHCLVTTERYFSFRLLKYSRRRMFWIFIWMSYPGPRLHTSKLTTNHAVRSMSICTLLNANFVRIVLSSITISRNPRDNSLVSLFIYSQTYVQEHERTRHCGYKWKIKMKEMNHESGPVPGAVVEFKFLRLKNSEHRIHHDVVANADYTLLLL